MLTLVIDLTSLLVLHGLSPVDVEFRGLTVGNGGELPVDDLVNRCGYAQALTLVVVVRDRTNDFPIINGHILERLTESFAEFDEEGAAHIDSLLVVRLEGALWPQFLLAHLELGDLARVNVEILALELIIEDLENLHVLLSCETFHDIEELYSFLVINTDLLDFSWVNIGVHHSERDLLLLLLLCEMVEWIDDGEAFEASGGAFHAVEDQWVHIPRSITFKCFRLSRKDLLL